LTKCVVLDDASSRRQNSADNAADLEVICKKKMPDGSTHNVTVQQLKKCLSKVRLRAYSNNRGKILPAKNVVDKLRLKSHH